MKTFNIMLKSINDVKDFVNIVNKYDFDVDLTSAGILLMQNPLWVFSVLT